jgi:hypothetical protein
MSVIGLDFGNEFAVLAIAKRGGVDIVLNENSQRQNRCGCRLFRTARCKCQCLPFSCVFNCWYRCRPIAAHTATLSVVPHA